MLKIRKGDTVVFFDGKTGTLSDLAKQFGIKFSAMRRRFYYKHKSLADAHFATEIEIYEVTKKPQPTKKQKSKNCIHCGSEFIGRNRLLCSDKCSKERKLMRVKERPINIIKVKKAVCPICGTHFEITDGLNRIYCSKPCSEEGKRRSMARFLEKSKAIKKQKREERKAARLLEREILAKEKKKAKAESRRRSCAHCGNEFIANRPDRTTCSYKCYDAIYRREYKKRTKEANANKEPIRIVAHQKKCPSCGKEFETEHESKIYCSKLCSKRTWRNKHSASGHQKAKRAISGRLRETLRKKQLTKSSPVMNYVGCTTIELREQLEAQMSPEMTWDNYGVFGWHIDHIVPCAAFDLSQEDHIHLCFNKNNLRPLWFDSNIAKADTISRCDIESLDSKYLERLVSAGIVQQRDGEWRVVRHAFCK